MSADVLQIHIPRESDGPVFYHGLPPSTARPSPSRRYTPHPVASTRTAVPVQASTEDYIAYNGSSTVPPSSIVRPGPTDWSSTTPTQSTTNLEHILIDAPPGLDVTSPSRHPSSRTTQVLETPPPSPAWNDAIGDDPSESLATDTTRSDSPLATPTIADDTFMKQLPSRQVDFLSHEWREEDIWSSWRHIVTQRKTYGEQSRLENASWRTWTKTKYRLATVSPEKLNWLKESDVTWLYGPLQPARTYPITSDRSVPSSHISKNNSFINKKPILKKRSMSEIMLQKSLSTSSLLKQAAASVQAQGEIDRRCAQMSDLFDSKMHSATPSRDQFDYFASHGNSSISTPGEPQERKHIRFDDRVEQCIAVDARPVLTEDESDVHANEAVGDPSDSDSDDGIMMRAGSGRSTPKRSRSNSLSGMKTIETLPSTTLKYRTDSPDIAAEAQHHTFGRSWGFGRLGQSPSQETLRPARPSSNFLINEDDEDDQQDADSSSTWSFGSSNPKSSLGASASRHGSYEIEGMRRTESGMFMPYDEDEDEVASHGLFGRVSETINTARDIAHVIWNVGWRK